MKRRTGIILSFVIFLIVVAVIVTVLIVVLRGGKKKKTLNIQQLLTLFGGDLDESIYEADLQEIPRGLRVFEPVRDGEFRQYVGLRPNDFNRVPEYSIRAYYDAAGTRALNAKKEAIEKLVPKIPGVVLSGAQLLDLEKELGKGNLEPVDPAKLTREQKRQVCEWLKSSPAKIESITQYDAAITKYWGKEYTLEEAKKIAKNVDEIAGFIRDNASFGAKARTFFFTMPDESRFTGATSTNYLMWIKEDMVDAVQARATIYRGPDPKNMLEDNWAKYDDLMLSGVVVLVATGMTDNQAKQYCMENFATHFERRTKENVVVIKNFNINSTSQLWNYGCEMYCEGLMSDSPDGGGYTWARLDMAPIGKRLLYQGKLEYMKFLKENSNCDSACHASRIMGLIGIISLILLPLTLPLGFAPTLAAISAATTISLRALNAVAWTVFVVDVATLSLEVVFQNITDLRAVRSANRAAMFRDEKELHNNMDLVLPGWQYYFLWHKGEGNFDGMGLLPKCACGKTKPQRGRANFSTDIIWSKTSKYGVEAWEKFLDWPKAKYNYSDTFFNYITYQSLTKDTFLRDKAVDEFKKDCGWYMDQAGETNCKEKGGHVTKKD